MLQLLMLTSEKFALGPRRKIIAYVSGSTSRWTLKDNCKPVPLLCFCIYLRYGKDCVWKATFLILEGDQSSQTICKLSRFSGVQKGERTGRCPRTSKARGHPESEIATIKMW